jgi:hypothetical protein
MAVVTCTEEILRIPLGDLVMITLRCSGAVAENATDEFLRTGLSKITAIVGNVIIGATTSTSSFTFKKNAQGTAAAAVAENGALGFETAVDVDVFEVTVIGTP